MPLLQTYCVAAWPAFVGARPDLKRAVGEIFAQHYAV
jgi:hypothetical protein